MNVFKSGAKDTRDGYISLHVWRGVGMPDNRDGQPLGQWDTVMYPLDSRANAERAYASYTRQGFHVDMVIPRG